MRWLFLLLLVLNVFYYVWSQQDAPLRPKEVAPLALYKNGRQDIRLLSEAPGGSAGASLRPQCLYLGGLDSKDQLGGVQRRLSALGVQGALVTLPPQEGGGAWVRMAPETQALLRETSLQTLSNEFNGLKHKIMQCEGIATGE
jgi:hypothetical protein